MAINRLSPEAITMPDAPTSIAACAEAAGTTMLAEMVAEAGSTRRCDHRGDRPGVDPSRRTRAPPQRCPDPARPALRRAIPRIPPSDVDISVTAPSRASATAIIEPSRIHGERAGPRLHPDRADDARSPFEVEDDEIRLRGRPVRGDAGHLRRGRPQHRPDPAVAAHLDERREDRSTGPGANPRSSAWSTSPVSASRIAASPAVVTHEDVLGARDEASVRGPARRHDGVAEESARTLQHAHESRAGARVVGPPPVRLGGEERGDVALRGPQGKRVRDERLDRGAVPLRARLL